MSASQHRILFGLALLSSIATASSSSAGTTTVTTYTHNADGALTSVTVEASNEPATTTFLVWDNFVPDDGDPNRGQVRRGNGTLAGFGPTTSPQGFTEAFAFDARDRLTQFNGDALGETYGYHANGAMSSSFTADDELRFYYEPSQEGQACNLHQSQSGLWSAYLAGSRYLDDGTEQVLVKPRKDTAGVYQPAFDRYDAYVYDGSYGRTVELVGGEYDLTRNPFQYTGEYRDPLWGGYYLRTRWYHPDLATFISRDPEANLSRYAYVAGNPVMRADPTGTSYMSEFGRPLGKFLTNLNKGVGGDFARVFLAPALGPLQILANPAGFWDAVKHNRAQIDTFLALSIAVEVVGGIMDSEVAGYAVSLGQRFAARALVDAGLGIAQSVAAGYSRGRQFDWNSLREGLEYTAGAILFRSYTGFNVSSSFQLDTDDFGRLLRELDDAPPRTAMVFRVRRPLSSSGISDSSGRISRYVSSSPLREAANLGSYHEELIAVTRDEFFQSHAIDTGLALLRNPNPGYDTLANSLELHYGGKAQMEYVGKVENFRAKRFLSNPRNLRITAREGTNYGNPRGTPRQYGAFRNNCQHHATAVLKNLGLR